jgi:hypothetical protein
MELMPLGCHRWNAAKVAIHNLKAHFLSILARVADDFPPNLCDWLLLQTEITINLIWQFNAAPNILAYVDLSNSLITTKCHSLLWDLKPRCMRKPTNTVYGHIIRSTDGISSHHQNKFAHTIVTSSTPRANNYLTWSNFNTNASPIPPSHMLTK